RRATRRAEGNRRENMARSKIAGALALVGLVAVATAGYYAFARRDGSVKEGLGQLAKSLDTATMSEGTYLVQLEEAEIMSGDWSLNAMGTPRTVRLKVTSGGRELATHDLGAFRGRKSFLEHPVTFEVDYDAKTPIEIELAEFELLSEGRRYYTKSPWP